MLKILSFILSSVISSGCLVKSAIAQDYRGLQSNPNHDIILLSNEPASFNQSSSQKNDYLVKILIIAGLTSGVGVLGWSLSRDRSSKSPKSIIGNPKNKALIDRVSPKLRRKLLRLINDPKTANRLLMGIQKDHPNRPPDWLADKVIYDLQRGR